MWHTLHCFICKLFGCKRMAAMPFAIVVNVSKDGKWGKL